MPSRPHFRASRPAPRLASLRRWLRITSYVPDSASAKKRRARFVASVQHDVLAQDLTNRIGHEGPTRYLSSASRGDQRFFLGNFIPPLSSRRVDLAFRISEEPASLELIVRRQPRVRQTRPSQVCPGSRVAHILVEQTHGGGDLAEAGPHPSGLDHSRRELLPRPTSIVKERIAPDTPLYGRGWRGGIRSCR
jgi:hypothetical protein